MIRGSRRGELDRTGGSRGSERASQHIIIVGGFDAVRGQGHGYRGRTCSDERYSRRASPAPSSGGRAQERSTLCYRVERNHGGVGYRGPI
eukprot:6470540-Pyramimonas_sp.AAC.1